MIETRRCVLVSLEKTDYEDIKKLYADESVRKYLGGTIDEESFSSKFSAMCNKDPYTLYWVIKNKHQNQFMGLISLDTHHDGVNKEVSYQILPMWWGCCYATEVVERIITYAFNELCLPRVVAETQSANKASCRMLEKVGMSLEQRVQRFGAEQSIYSIKNEIVCR